MKSKLIEWATYGKFGRPIEPVEKDPFENYVGLNCSGTINTDDIVYGPSPVSDMIEWKLKMDTEAFTKFAEAINKIYGNTP